MIVLSAKEIKKSFGIDIIIKNASFTVQDNTRCYRINGRRKSTLFKIITGEIEKE